MNKALLLKISFLDQQQQHPLRAYHKMQNLQAHPIPAIIESAFQQDPRVLHLHI